jgi:glucose/arabinose dehydrogenase
MGVSEEGLRKMKMPRGMHACADGSLLVADFGNHCVFRFKPGDLKGEVVAGEEGRALPEVDPMKDIDKCMPMAAPEGAGYRVKAPGDVCEDSADGIFVLDTQDCRVQLFGGPNRGGPATLVLPADQKSLAAPEAVKNPRALFRCENGALVVVDTWSHRVVKFGAPGGPEGSEKPVLLAGTPNSTGSAPEKLCYPSAAAFGADGALYVTDTNRPRVQRFEPGPPTPGKTVVGSKEAGKAGKGLAELDMPTGLCIDPRDGSLLVADRGNARVLRFKAAARAGDEGEVVAGPEEGLERPWGLCLDAEGALYVSDERKGMVLKLELPAQRSR